MEMFEAIWDTTENISMSQWKYKRCYIQREKYMENTDKWTGTKKKWTWNKEVSFSKRLKKNADNHIS